MRLDHDTDHGCPARRQRRAAALLAAIVATVALAGPGGAQSHTVADSLAWPAAETRAWQTGVLPSDKLQHASLAFSSGLGIGILSQEPGLALGGALALGAAKELWDSRHTHWDNLDLVADALGAALAAVATIALTR